MRRVKVRYRPEALADLSDIFRFVLRASQNVVTAETFVQRITARCNKIGDVPYGGRPRDDLEPGLRTVPFEHSAVIAYKVEAKQVRVTNVFYGGRDYEALYPRDNEETKMRLHSRHNAPLASRLFYVTALARSAAAPPASVRSHAAPHAFANSRTRKI